MSEAQAFTSWKDLYRQLLNDLASPSFRTMQSYTVSSGGAGGSRQVSYRSLSELKSLIDWVKIEMDEEQLGPYHGRTFAVNGGRG
jgi:hypothetical protein